MLSGLFFVSLAEGRMHMFSFPWTGVNKSLFVDEK